MRYAGFWIRVVAYLLDSLIVLLVAFPIMVVVNLGSASAHNDIETAQIAFLVNAVGGWLYFAFFESGSWQATPGKRILGLMVTDLAGSPIGFGRATGRYFGKILSFLTVYIGFIMAGLTDKKQCLHDKLADTLVLYGNAGQKTLAAELAQTNKDEAAQTNYSPHSGVNRWVMSGFDADGHVVRLSFSQDTPKMDREGLLIGRDAKTCDLHMNDATLSRRHARVFNEQGTVWLEDLASANGTMVNGRSVKPGVAVELPQQGVITFGAVELSIVKY